MSRANIPTVLPQVGRGPAEINGVPMDDGADHQVEAGSPESLAFIRPIPDFAALVEKDGALQFMGGFALVETGLTTPAECRRRIPFDHEQRTLVSFGI